MAKKIKAAIIGYGYMGKIRKRIVEEHPALKLAGICEINPSTMAPDPAVRCKIYRSYQELLNTGIDLVFVCTPNHLSPEVVISALRGGKHVFCEKPPGRGLKDIEDMRQAERENPGLKLMFGFNHRYHPGILEAKGLVESGRLGEILFLKGIYGKSGGKNYLQSWRNQKEISGGGILLDQGIHMLDLFRFFLGDFNEAKGFLSKMFWGAEVEDNAFVYLRNEAGQVATLHSSATLWKHCFRLEIFMEQAYLIVSGLLSKTGSYGRETLTIGRRQFEGEALALGNPREEVVYFDQDLSWKLEVDKFIDCVIKNQPVKTSSSQDALKAMEIIDRIYKEENIVSGPLIGNKGEKK
ncbi:MAG: Gfo/Idh/MocA family oxidoreductase [Candidatus Margulisiibacteriota bacterium]